MGPGYVQIHENKIPLSVTFQCNSYLAYDYFKCILLKISVLYFNKNKKNYRSWFPGVRFKMRKALVQAMAWHQAGDKLLCEPLPTKSCDTIASSTHPVLDFFGKMPQAQGPQSPNTYARADPSRLVPSQWETALLCNGIPHWLGTSLESALYAQCAEL